MVFHWPQGMWDLTPSSEIEPAPPVLEVEVLTTGPPGKSLDVIFIMEVRYEQMFFSIYKNPLQVQSCPILLTYEL